MTRNGLTVMVVALLLGAPAAGCAQIGAQADAQGGSQLGGQIPPSLGGLPADTPPRPQVIAPTPAVHDLPPPRSEPPLNAAEQLKLEKDLAAARASQGKLQDPGAVKRAEDANAANSAAAEKAKAAAKQVTKPAPKPKPVPQ
jgi:hypothetical protein